MSQLSARAGPYRLKDTDDRQAGVHRPPSEERHGDHYHHNDQEVRFVGPRNLSSSSMLERLNWYKNGKEPTKTEIPTIPQNHADATRIGGDVDEHRYGTRRLVASKLRPVSTVSWAAYDRDYKARQVFSTPATIELTKKEIEGQHYRQLY